MAMAMAMVMVMAAQKTENAVCWESRRGGDIKRHAGRAAYAAPLKNAAGRLTPKI